MRYLGMVFAAAVSCAIGVFANAPAKAAVFGFSFGPDASGNVASGTFTTDGPAPGVPGFDLITNLTFDTLSGTTIQGTPFSFTNQAASFASEAAFNPATGAFTSSGGRFDNIGFVEFSDVSIDALSFTQGAQRLTGEIIPTAGGIVVLAPLKITPIPEPSTWAMTLLGFGGLGFLGYRRTRKAQPQAA